MQYLSQRLEAKSAGGWEGTPTDRSVAAGQRGRILDAVEALLAERGFAGASIERIVKRAGVSTVSFYEHFESKEACVVAAFERAIAEIEAKIGAAADELPWPDRVHEALRTLLGAIDAEPARARACLVEAQKGGPELLAAYDASLDRAAAVLRRGRSWSTGHEPLPDALEQATVAGLAWLLRERLELTADPRVDDLLERMVDIALSPYLEEGQEALVGDA